MLSFGGRNALRCDGVYHYALCATLSYKPRCGTLYNWGGLKALDGLG